MTQNEIDIKEIKILIHLSNLSIPLGIALRKLSPRNCQNGAITPNKLTATSNATNTNKIPLNICGKQPNAFIFLYFVSTPLSSDRPLLRSVIFSNSFI